MRMTGPHYTLAIRSALYDFNLFCIEIVRDYQMRTVSLYMYIYINMRKVVCCFINIYTMMPGWHSRRYCICETPSADDWWQAGHVGCECAGEMP